MSIEDYMRKNEEIRKNTPPFWAKYYYSIDHYDIPEEKKELIDELHRYIKQYNTYYMLNYLLYLGDTTMIQTVTTTGERMGVRINTRDWKFDGYREESFLHELTEEQFMERINKYKQVGSQKFYDYSFGYRWEDFQSVNMGIQHIYYSFDDNTFIDEELAQKLKEVDIDELGLVLARDAEILRNNKKGFTLDDDRVNFDLKNRYEQGKIPQYTFKDGELTYLGKQKVKKK